MWKDFMATIYISNFLSIKTAKIEIKKFTVLIGPQATGKSIIAKLAYLFLEIPAFMVESVLKNGKIRSFKHIFINRFKEIFPEYTWNSMDFEIAFETEKGKVSIIHKKGKSIALILSNFYCNTIIKLSLSVKAFSPRKDILENNVYELREFSLLHHITEEIEKIDFGFETKFGNCIYIPAGRSFFASFAKNVFSFISNNINIDYFLKQFGKTYESIKNRYSVFEQQKSDNDFIVLSEKAIGGKYFYDSTTQKEYILGEVRTEIKDSSSGQQELLPVLLTICTTQKTPVNYLLEEPEAHIFPATQSSVVRYIAKVASKVGSSFFITTHSPYVLSVFNNLLYAGYLYEKNISHKDKLRDISKITPKDQQISHKEFSAYLIKDGKSKSIIDEETKLIDGNELDAISEEESNIFSKLMELD